MKMKHLLFGIVITTAVSSCNNSIKGSGNIVTSTRPRPEFTGIVSNGSFNVYIKQSPESAVRISTDDNILPYVETTVRNGTLTLSCKENNIRNSVRIYVYVSGPVIEKITLEGSGVIKTTHTLVSRQLSLFLNGSGKIAAEAVCETAHVQLNGSGNILLTGQTKNQTALLNGSGSLNTSGFAAENTRASLSGSGMLRVHTTTNLQADISGSGLIRYSGKPVSVTKTISGSGTIESQ